MSATSMTQPYGYTVTNVLSSLPGISLGQMLKLLWKQGNRISPAYFPRVAFHLMSGTMVSILARLENVFFQQPPSTTKAVAPVFVLGHWRSGTTFLHRLLAADPTFIAPTQYQATLPHCFQITERWLKAPVQRSLPKTRGYDNVAIDLDAAWEDETALFTMTLLSPMLASMFPRDGEQHARFLSLDGLSDRERRLWEAALNKFLIKATGASQGRPLLKSPPHTARVRLLSQLYPDARFIHIHRHPFDVYNSTLRMMEIFGRQVQLQKPHKGDIEKIVISHYKAMHEAYFEQRNFLPTDRLLEISYDALCTDPITHLAQIYKQLQLGDFACVKSYVEHHLSTVSNYQRNRMNSLPLTLQKQLRREWQISFDQWDYA